MVLYGSGDMSCNKRPVLDGFTQHSPTPRLVVHDWTAEARILINELTCFRAGNSHVSMMWFKHRTFFFFILHHRARWLHEAVSVCTGKPIAWIKIYEPYETKETKGGLFWEQPNFRIADVQLPYADDTTYLYGQYMA